MNRYQNQSPRAAFAIAAVVMSLATMTAFVGAPAMMNSDSLTVTARATPVAPAASMAARVEAPVTMADASVRR